MALNAYLRMKGQKLGEIKGSVTQKGREGKIMVWYLRMIQCLVSRPGSASTSPLSSPKNWINPVHYWTPC